MKQNMFIPNVVVIDELKQYLKDQNQLRVTKDYPVFHSEDDAKDYLSKEYSHYGLTKSGDEIVIPTGETIYIEFADLGGNVMPEIILGVVDHDDICEESSFTSDLEITGELNFRDDLNAKDWAKITEILNNYDVELL